MVSLATGLVSGLVVGNDLHYRVARRLRLTERTGRSDVWQDCFSTFDNNWLEVELDDGRRVSGWAQYFSEIGSTPSLFLRDAFWIDNGNLIPIEGEGILLTESAKIRYVEFRGPEGGINGHE